MTKRLPSSLLLGCAALLLFATAAQAQVVRPSNTLFLALRGGATAYGGELDGTGSQFADGDDSELGWLFRDLGYGIGGELGYQFTRSLGFSLGALYGQYPNLERTDYIDPATGATGQVNEGDAVLQVQALFRYFLFPNSRITPYLQLGGVAAFGPGEDSSGDRITGYGPHLGGGLDFLIGRQLSLFLEASGVMIFPDDAIDGLNPGANVIASGDDADFDALNFYGAGLRFFFKPGGVALDATIDCATELETGQTGSFTAMTNADATQPITYTWNWGDGTTSEGMTAQHSYAAPGTYTVTMEARGPVNRETETCLVTVVDRPEPPVLTNCRASATNVGIGDEVTINANVAGEEPVSITVDFGDGTTANSLPARHTYSANGTYTVTITATNADGTDTCTVTVNVGDRFCDEVTELNTVYFDYGMSTLTDEARARLDENLEVLRRCPDICVVVNAYADDQESDKLRLSERRAAEVKAYYVANGIDESRVLARGLGEAPDANSKEDPGPGDRNARRAESIPTPCEQMNSMGGGM